VTVTGDAVEIELVLVDPRKWDRSGCPVCHLWSVLERSSRSVPAAIMTVPVLHGDPDDERRTESRSTGLAPAAQEVRTGRGSGRV
jgi:hypothetical protein